MRARTTTLAVAAAITLPLSGCGGAAEGAGDPLEFWNLLSGDDSRYMEQIVDEYNAGDPEIPVAFKPAPREDMYMRMYSVARAGSDIPDLTLVHNLAIAELAESDLLDPVEPLLDAEAGLAAENYLGAAWRAGRYDGVQWGVPLDLHGLVTYYNEDLLAEHGAEHILDDELVSIEELMELQGNLPEGVYATTSFFAPGLVYNWQYSVADGVGEQGGGAEGVDFTRPGYDRAIDALAGLREAGLMAPEDSDAAQVFRSGGALFHPAGTWELSGHQGIDGLDFGIAHSMQLDARRPVNFFESHSFVQMADETRSDRRDAAVADFLEFVRTHSMPWAEAGQIVASREVFDSPDYEEYPQSYFTEPDQEELLVTDTYEYADYVSAALWEDVPNVIFGRHSRQEAAERMNDEVRAQIEMVEAP